MKILFQLCILFFISKLHAMQPPVKTYDPKATEKLQDKVRWLVEHAGSIHENKVKDGADTIVTLVKEGADPNVECGTYKALPISWAAGRGFVDIISELLELGANPNLQNSITLFDALDSGNFPLETRKKMIRLLLEYGANPNEKREVTRVYPTDPAEELLLSFAFKICPSLCELLFSYGADPKMLSKEQQRFLIAKLK